MRRPSAVLALFVVLTALGGWVDGVAPALAQRRGIQMRPGDNLVGREFRRGGTGYQRFHALDAPRPIKFRNAKQLKHAYRVLGRPRNSRTPVSRTEMELALVYGRGGAPETTSQAPIFAFNLPTAKARRAAAPDKPSPAPKREARPVKRVRMKPTMRHQEIDEANAYVSVYGRTEDGGPDVEVVGFQYNNQTGQAVVRMPRPEIAANGDEVKRQFTDNGKHVDQDEFVLDLVPELAKFYNGRKRTEISLDFGGGNDAPDPRYEELTTRAQTLRAANPQLSWEDATRQAFASLHPGIIKSLKKHGYDPGKLRLTFMPEGPDAHASFRVTTGEKPVRHNAITLLLQTASVLVTGPFRKPALLRRLGKPDLKHLLLSGEADAKINSKYTKAAKKLTETARLITLTAQAKGKRKALTVAGILVDVASIDIGPLNNIVVDDVTGRPTPLVVDGMPYEQIALREGLAAYKGKTKPVIRQVFAGPLPDQIGQRAEDLFASLPAKGRTDAGYQRALAQAVFELVPIASDLASIGYDVTNLEVRPRGDGYMLLQFTP